MLILTTKADIIGMTLMIYHDGEVMLFDGSFIGIIIVWIQKSPEHRKAMLKRRLVEKTLDRKRTCTVYIYLRVYNLF